MRKSLPVLPQRSVGLSYLPNLPAGGRFDLLSAGMAAETAPSYNWDNRRRPPGLLLQYTLEGEGRVGDARKRHARPVRPSEAMLLLFPSDTRYWLPPGGAWRFIWLVLGGEPVLALGRQLISEHGVLFPLPETSIPVATMLDLYRQATSDAPPDESAINLGVHRLLLELGCALRPAETGVPEPIAAARDLIEQRFDDPALSVDDLGDAAGYSRYHFSRLFKQHLGVTPYQHLLRRRIRHALELLANTDEPIKRVALQCGFNDVSWFCAAFRKQMRTSPGAARKQRTAR